ncbi:PAS domain S-box protein [Aureimonas phyllosphaerae]|uniref:sensor histidine kinase n=1 Tax=Aureimonas phyllosphaerae TaxID=1166078 RepID=UPI003A5BD29F
MKLDEPRHSPTRDRQIIESITEFAIIVTDREGIVTDWNAGAEHILGWSAREMIGRSAELFFTPEDREIGRCRREMRTSLEAGRAIDERWHLKRDGSRFWASGEMMPLRDENDRHAGFVKVLRDRTEQSVAQRASRDNQEQLEAIFSQSPSFMALLRGPEHRFERVNPGYVRLVGGRDVVGRTVAEVLPETSSQGFIDLLDDVYHRGEAHHSIDTPITLQSGPDAEPQRLFLDFVYQPIRDADGNVVGVFVEGVDVTQRIMSARRLREAEDRYRALAENVNVGMCVVEMKFDEDGKAIDYRIIDGNPAYERHTGLYGSVGKWVSEIAPGLERHWFDTYGKVALTGEPARLELGAAGLGNRTFEIEAYRVGDPDRRHVAILFTDITQRRQAEERRSLLNHELAHRLKNTLAVVQSIATQTLRTAPDLVTARSTLASRVQALAKAHDILLTGQQDAGSVEALIHGAVSLHDPEGRIALRGPNLYVGPKAALTLSLIMHELSTNAAKYGALSVPDGKINVDWVVDVEETTRLPTLALSWRETDGPPAAAPQRKGFGTRLIEMGLSGSSGGSVELDYAEDGLKCRIVAPLTELQANDEL